MRAKVKPAGNPHNQSAAPAIGIREAARLAKQLARRKSNARAIQGHRDAFELAVARSKNGGRP